MRAPHAFAPVLVAVGMLTGCAHDRHAVWTLVAERAAQESAGPSEGRVTFVELASQSSAHAEVCVDWYEHGDAPGHPSHPCYRSIDFYALRLVDGWRIFELKPMVFACMFESMDREDHIDGMAETGRTVPRPDVHPVIDMRR